MWLGLAGGASSILVGLWAAYVRLFTNRAVPGWTTVMALASFGFSLQLLVTGILGEYLGRMYEEIKGRPMYVISEELNTVAPADGRDFEPARQFARVD
jgi:polyisoprenyl-phosphate glycosyltransferase